MPDTIRWYATLLVFTWCFAPLARLVAGRLPSRGAFIAKPLGLLATVWPVWFLASFSPFPYAAAALWAVAAIGGIAGWALLVRRGAVERAWLLHLLAAEVIALVAYVGLIGLRGFTPQIAGTEKPMDVAFLASSARATDMPPADPWMAGESINYYYLGYVLHGTLARLSGVPTWVGYNLALATTFAMTVTAAAGLGYDLVRVRLGRALAVAASALAAFFVVIAGNMRAPIEFLRDPSGVWNAFWWQSIGWQSSRVVIDHGSGTPETINEFPSFSFILGDLHPHVMALPFTLVSLTIAMALMRGSKFRVLGSWEEAGDRPLGPVTGGVREAAGDDAATAPTSEQGTQNPEPQSSPTPSPQPLAPRPFSAPNPQPLAPAALVLAGAVIGALYPLNSWDFPTYLGAAAIALVFAFGWSRDALIRAAVLGIAAIVAWAPFWLGFVPFAGGDAARASRIADLPVVGRIAETIAGYSGERTSAGEFLTVFGIPWAIGVVALAVEAGHSLRRSPVRLPRWVILPVAMVLVLALGFEVEVLVLAGVPLAVAAWLIGRRDPDEPERTVVATLLAAGFGLILVSEFFYVQDFFAGRMNTLFKVYYQVWTLLGIAGAVAVARLWRLAAGNRALQSALGAGVALAVVLGVAYPVISAKTWTVWQGPRDWQGLDGAAYIAEYQPNDLAAIRWLADNARDGDVVLEAPGCSYQVNGGVPTSRIAAFTGVPSIIGWIGSHENLWRAGQPELDAQIGPRADDVRALYQNPNDTALLDRYGVTLLYVGTFEEKGTESCERAGPYAGVADPAYPGAGWTEIYNQGNVRIFRRAA